VSSYLPLVFSSARKIELDNIVFITEFCIRISCVEMQSESDSYCSISQKLLIPLSNVMSSWAVDFHDVCRPTEVRKQVSRFNKRKTSCFSPDGATFCYKVDENILNTRVHDEMALQCAENLPNCFTHFKDVGQSNSVLALPCRTLTGKLMPLSRRNSSRPRKSFG